MLHNRSTELGLTSVVGVQGSTAVWAPGTEPLLARNWSGVGRRPKLLRRDDAVKPVKLSELSKSLPAKARKTVHWRGGTKGALVSRFATLRVRPSHRDYWRAEPWPREWLLIEWPEGEKEPALDPASRHPHRNARGHRQAPRTHRARLPELKQEINLDHYEGRGWRGFHHHAALSIAAYGFLVAERGLIPPSALIVKTLAAPDETYRPRGAANPA